MVPSLEQRQATLYDADYNLWLEETVRQLQKKFLTTLIRII